MLNKRMQDLTLKDGLIVTAVLTGISLVPALGIWIWAKVQENKQRKEAKKTETETEN